MRIVSQTLAIVGILLAPVLLGGASASAASECPVGYTGPDSNNICTSVQTYTCTVTNNNQVVINNQNAQGTVSGNAGGQGNTQTGTATNSNGATFNFEITNQGICTAVRTVPPVTTVQPRPTAPRPAATVAPMVKTTPPVLANTSSNTVAMPFVVMVIIGLTALSIRAVLLAHK